MTSDRPSPCIVVGYDGSPSSRAALAVDHAAAIDRPDTTADAVDERVGA
jgi:hypothetical protein